MLRVRAGLITPPLFVSGCEPRVNLGDSNLEIPTLSNRLPTKAHLGYDASMSDEPIHLTLPRGDAVFLNLLLKGLHTRQLNKLQGAGYNRKPIQRAEMQTKAYLLDSLANRVDRALNTT